MQKIHIGEIHADYVTMPESIDYIEGLVRAKKGGFIVTPNVDHVVLAEKNEALRAAYSDASLSLADGMPLVWASRMAGFPLPEKISGSDLVRPMLRRAAQAGMRVYFLGSAPGVGSRAAEILVKELPGLNIVGIDAPPLGFEIDPAMEAETLAKMLSTRPDLVLVALGCPKQEILMHRWFKQGIGQVMLGIGGSLDLITGEFKRSPRWMSNAGLEWLYRLIQDPRRLAKRYLIQDSGFFRIFLRMMRMPRGRRLFFSE